MARALVLGAALCMREDAEAAMDLAPFDTVIAVKGAVMHWPSRVDVWVTLHPERARADVGKRVRAGLPRPALQVCHEGKRYREEFDLTVPYLFEGQTISGSSGLFGVKVALYLKHTRVVLCGVPMQNKAGKLDQASEWAGEKIYRKGFEQAMPHICNNVRSMSGWTAQLLGKPTTAWLES